MPLDTPGRCLRLLAAALATLVAAPVTAQVVGDCAPGRAERDLNINDVQARLFNGGNLFFGNTTVAGDGYFVPKRLGLSPIFDTVLWVGGKVGSELRMASANFTDFEFWPGPLDAEGNPPADCAAFDRIYRVSRGDVARYLATGEATDDLREWPVDLGAPVLDGDGVAGNYNLEGGDEPAISGEQMAWWVMNDAGNEHVSSQTPPIRLEARVEAFAAPSLVPAIDQATFYRYRFTYRGDLPLDSAYVTMYMETDLGDPVDDYVGSDTTLDLGFTYNGDNNDIGGYNGGYGANPPALGLKVVRGPVGLPNGRDDDDDGVADEEGERLGMTAFPCWAKTLEPRNGVEIYNCMQGLWRDGTPLTVGDDGYETDGPVTTFSLSGDPVTEEFWSEENLDGEGTDGVPDDRRFFVVTGPFRMEPGDTEEFVFALPFARGADRLDSIVKLRAAAAYLQRAYDLGFFEPQRMGVGFEPESPQAFALRAYPNPFASSAAVELTVADGAGSLRLAVYDVLGREVAVLADGVLPPGEHPFALGGAGLPAGVYFVRLETGRQAESLKLVHIR